MAAPKRLMTAALCAGLCLRASASVIDIPSSPVPSLTVPSVVNAGLPASPLSLPFNSSPLMPLSPSLTPLPSPLPSSPIPTRALAVAAAIPSFPEAPEPAAQARSLNNFWDGMRATLDFEEPSAAAVSLAGIAEEPIGQAERLAPWLATDDPKIAAALDRAVELAGRTRAGRRALDGAEAILAKKPLPVVVAALGRNYGEYDFVAISLRLHKALFEKGRETDLAGTLVHELTHVVQHAQGVPSNALEMEIEAHLQDLEMLAELGVEPPRGTFARQALDALARGPAKFIELIAAAVPGTVFLAGQTFDEITEQLEQDLDAARGRKSKSAAGLARAIERDLDLLGTEEGRASYRAFSRRVLALLRRRASAL